MVPKHALIIRLVQGLVVGIDFDWELAAVYLWVGPIMFIYVWNTKTYKEALMEFSKDTLNGQ